MKATHTTTYTADDGTEYADARLCAAHEQVLVKGEHAYGTIEFEKARDALAATSPTPIVLDSGDGALLQELGLLSSPQELDGEIVIRTGDRILQPLLVPILRPTVTLVDAIDPSGRGGLGSTGVA